MRSYSAFVQYLVDRGNWPTWDGLTPGWKSTLPVGTGARAAQAGEEEAEGRPPQPNARCGVATLGFVGRNVVVYQIPAVTSAELPGEPTQENGRLGAHLQAPGSGFQVSGLV